MTAASNIEDYERVEYARSYNVSASPAGEYVSLDYATVDEAFEGVRALIADGVQHVDFYVFDRPLAALERESVSPTIGTAA